MERAPREPLINQRFPKESLNNPMFAVSRGRGGLDVKLDASGNWRVVFRFENGEAVDVDLIDYH